MGTANAGAADDMRTRRTGKSGAPVRSRARSVLASPPAWGLAGFLVGAVFWHFVGFWSFVSKVVFKGGGAVATVEEPGKLDRALDGRERAFRLASTARCVDLRLDRAGRMVVAHACEGTAALIKAGPVASRGDLALTARMPAVPAVAGWSTQVRDSASASLEKSDTVRTD